MFQVCMLSCQSSMAYSGKRIVKGRISRASAVPGRHNDVVKLTVRVSSGFEA